MHTYDTVSAATNGLRERGYTVDFNLDKNCLICSDIRLHADDFEVTEVHRFEGASDPADEAVVYAIEGKNGEKGSLVTGYGISAEGISADIAKKLTLHRDS